MLDRVLHPLRRGISGFLLLAGGALAGVLLAGCGGGEGAQEKSALPVAGSFVGEVSEFAGPPEALPFVAVVADSGGTPTNRTGCARKRKWMGP